MEKSTWLNTLDQTIEAQTYEPHFCVPFIAKKMYLSERSLNRQIKRVVLLTPNQYIQKCRIEKGMEQLLSGKYKTVKEVCHKVGFRKVSCFSKLFVLHYGTYPSYLIKKRHGC